MSAKFLYRLSFSIFFTITLFMALPIYALFLDPINLICKYTEFYIIFLIVPYGASIFLYVAGRMKKKSESEN